MAARPRKATDEDVFLATMSVMSRATPGELTLAEIAAEAGVTAGALVQRFGSKRELMLEMFSRLAGAVDEQFAELRAAHASPLSALRAHGDCMAHMGSTPATFAHHLSYLQMDMTDPDFHAHAARQARAARESMRALLDEAVAARELKRTTDTIALARAVEVTLNGSLMTWAFHQEGTAREWIREDLDALLRPFLSTAAKKSTKANAKRTVRKRKAAGTRGKRS
jgi:AcrR family transcriptional regulator